MNINGHIVRRDSDSGLVYVDTETIGVYAPPGNRGGIDERKVYLEEQIERCNLIIEFLDAEASVIEDERKQKALKLYELFYNFVDINWDGLPLIQQKRFLEFSDKVELNEGS